MKKIFLLTLIIIGLFLFNYKKEDVSLVFNENEYNNNYDFDYFYITSNKINLTTNNLLKYFNENDEFKIIGLYPKLDKIYNINVKNQLNYFGFNSLENNRSNLIDFTNNYVLKLKDNNYIEEANLVYFEGVKIDKVLVYASYNSIYSHNLKYNKFDYKVKDF